MLRTIEEPRGSRGSVFVTYDRQKRLGNFYLAQRGRGRKRS